MPGPQAIGAAFGGKVIRAPKIFHGKTSQIHHDGKNISAKHRILSPPPAYHSLIVERKSLPRELTITAETDDGTIMGVRHRRPKLEGVQFHPESVLTQSGKQPPSKISSPSNSSRPCVTPRPLRLLRYLFSSLLSFLFSPIQIGEDRARTPQSPPNCLTQIFIGTVLVIVVIRDGHAKSMAIQILEYVHRHAPAQRRRNHRTSPSRVLHHLH